MRDAENYAFQPYAYLNSVRGINMHIVDQSRALENIKDSIKNYGINNLDKIRKK